MSWTWQDIVAIGLVLVAVGYLVYQARAVLLKKKAGGCGSCSSCPSETTADGRPMVTLDALPPERRAH